MLKGTLSRHKEKVKHRLLLQTKRNVMISWILEPATKPATVGNNKKPNIQPDPKKPGQTPHADKKTPGTTGRVSVGADKKGPGKVKTEGN